MSHKSFPMVMPLQPEGGQLRCHLGNPRTGGDSSAVSEALRSGVTQVFSTGSAFAALKEDGP